MSNDSATPRGRRPVRRGTGVTRAECYLGQLCDRTFLSLWSYPCVYGEHGKELCDLLVVFRDHIIIFSDKDCAFPDTGNLTNDWNRWYKRAIKKAADQIWGAERWIREHPDQLFLDPTCNELFPIELPNPASAVFHRIVVAHAGAERCRKEMNGGSGSLMIVSDVAGDMHYAGERNRGTPFWVGQVDPSKGFVHVLDDTSLDIVMGTLDTVSDFVAYLEKKEHFLSTTAVFATGEEDLLAFYLKRIGDDQEHDFILDRDYSAVCITEGEWEAFQRNPQRLAQIAANEISYSWDELIEKFSHHMLEDTQYFRGHGGIKNGEQIMRFLAGECRTKRRLLMQLFYGLLKRTRPDELRTARISRPDSPADPYYVFLLLRKPDHATYEEYREVRCKLLEAYCMALKVMCPEALDIVGIATEPGFDELRSEDAIYLDAHDWTPELEQEAVRTRDEFSLLKEVRSFSGKVSEYPEVAAESDASVAHVPAMKGRDRNAPCPCGSGRKFKKCCGLA